MLYILYAQYKPSTAPTNRAMAFFRRLSEKGKEAHVIYFTPDANKAKVKESFPGITFEYLWEKNYINVPGLRYLSYFRNLLALRRRLREGDKVYVYAKADLMRFIIGLRGVKVYYEITEHPEVHPPYGLSGKLALRDFLRHCRKLDGLFVISKGLESYFVSNGVRLEKIILFNMMVDENRFEGVERQPSDTRDVVFCGSLKNSIDGVDELIRAFAEVATQYPDAKLRVFARINKESKDYQDCRRLVDEKGLQYKVVFEGLVPFDEVPQRMVNATMLALDRPDCIQARYGFPTKLGEYLLSGNPVIVTAVGEIPLYLKDMDNALLAKPGSTQAFANKIKWVLDHPEESKGIGVRGKAAARELFSYKTEVDKVIKYLEI